MILLRLFLIARVLPGMIFGGGEGGGVGVSVHAALEHQS